MENPEFKTIKSYSINYGTRNFIEVALKEAIEGDEVNKFISISKGYTDREDNKRYKRSLGFKVDEAVIEFFIKTFPELKKELGKTKKE